MRIVTPFRPFGAESASHKRLGEEFNWYEAMCMLSRSASEACDLEVVGITDVDTELPIPSFQYRTEHRRLMPWIVEVAYRYVQSDDFDQDTVMVCPDILVFGDLGRWFEQDFDMALLGRNHVVRPIINSVQFWRHSSREAVRRIYGRVFDSLGELTERELTWGGDTTPFVRLSRVRPGKVVTLPGLGRLRYLPLTDVMKLFGKSMVGRKPPHRHLLDFKNNHRKRFMRQYYDGIFGDA